MRAQFPSAPEPWIDLSTGINPWPWPIPQQILGDRALLYRLPTRADTRSLTARLADRFNVPQGQVLPVPGTAMAIAQLPHVLNAQMVAVLSPSYGDHAHAWRRAGCSVIETADPLGHASDVDVIALCQPNNPDGRTFSTSALLSACEALRQRGGFLVVDQAYVEVLPDLCMARHIDQGNLIILRSIGKFYGLAGLRFGFVLGPPTVLDALTDLLGDWPISPLTLKIADMAYQDHTYFAETLTKLQKARARLDIILTRSGFNIVGGCDLFRFIKTPHATALWHHLGQAGIAIRRFDWSDHHVRIGLPANAYAEIRLAQALSDWALISTPWADPPQ